MNQVPHLRGSSTKQAKSLTSFDSWNESNNSPNSEEHFLFVFNNQWTAIKKHSFLNMSLSIAHTVFAFVFLFVIRSFLSISLFSLTVLNLGLSIAQIAFLKWSDRKSNLYFCFLYLNDIVTWALTCYSLFLFINFGTLILPMQTLASNKAQWIRHYFGNELSYGVVYGMTIGFAVLLILMGLLIGVSTLIMFYLFESTVSERFDRAIASWVILESLFALALGCLLMLGITWTVYYFAIILAITVLLTVVMMIGYSYYGIYRHEYEQKDTLNKVIGFSTVAIMVLHLILAIIVFCNQSKLYLKSYVDFANNFDESIVTSLLFKSKFYGTGSLDELSYCPKELLMPNWENASKPFGCLNLQAYYKGRSMTSFILDLTIMIPLLEIAIIVFINLFLNAINDFDDHVKNTVLYKKYQEPLRCISSAFFPIVSLILVIVILSYGKFTSTFPQVNPIKIEAYHDIVDHIIPPLYFTHTLDKSTEYHLTGTVLSQSDQSIEIMLTPEDKSLKPMSKPIKANVLFEIGELYAYEGKIPIEYSLSLKLNDKMELNLFTVRIGGLLTGRMIHLGEIPVDKSEGNDGYKGKVNGTLRDSQHLEVNMKAVEVFIIKGVYYPKTLYEICKTASFKLDNFFNYTLSNLNGEFEIDNLPQGYYTLIFIKDRYYLQTLQATITPKAEVITHSVFLTKIVKNNTLSIALEWPRGPKDLDLLLTFPVSDKAVCSVGYLNNCGGAEHIVQNNIGGNKGIEMIQIKDIGDFDYSFSVYHFINYSKDFIQQQFIQGLLKEEEEADVEEVLFNESKAKIKVYSHEHRYPFLNAQIPSNFAGRNWKVFEFNGNKGIGSIKLY